MVDLALQGGAIGDREATSRAKALAGCGSATRVFRHLTRAAAFAVLLILGGVIFSLVIGSLAGAARRSASASWSSERWNPVTENFGALAPIYGTLVTSFIAMLIAVPVGLLHRDVPHRALPAVAAPPDRHRDRAARRHSQHHLRHLGPVRVRAVPAGDVAAVPDRRVFGDVPVLSSLFAGPPYGIGMLTAGLILAIMVLPFITSISRDVFDAVPPVLKEAAYGLGCTTWEVVRYVVLPYTRVGVIGGVMLGLGRALGETMAVTFVIGNAHRSRPRCWRPAPRSRPPSPTNSPRRSATSTPRR